MQALKPRILLTLASCLFLFAGCINIQVPLKLDSQSAVPSREAAIEYLKHQPKESGLGCEFSNDGVRLWVSSGFTTEVDSKRTPYTSMMVFAYEQNDFISTTLVSNENTPNTPAKFCFATKTVRDTLAGVQASASALAALKTLGVVEGKITAATPRIVSTNAFAQMAVTNPNYTQSNKPMTSPSVPTQSPTATARVATASLVQPVQTPSTVPPQSKATTSTSVCTELLAHNYDLAKILSEGCQSERANAYRALNQFGNRAMGFRDARNVLVDYGLCGNELNKTAIGYGDHKSVAENTAYQLKTHQCMSSEQQAKFLSTSLNLATQAVSLSKAIENEYAQMNRQIKNLSEGVSAANAAEDLEKRRQVIDAGLNALRSTANELLKQKSNAMVQMPAVTPTNRIQPSARQAQLPQMPQQTTSMNDSCSKYAGVWGRYAGKWWKDLLLEPGCSGGEYCVQTLSDWNNAAGDYGWHCNREAERNEGMAGRVTRWSVNGDTLSIALDTGHQLNLPIQNRNSQVWVDDMIRWQARKR